MGFSATFIKKMPSKIRFQKLEGYLKAHVQQLYFKDSQLLRVSDDVIKCHQDSYGINK